MDDERGAGMEFRAAMEIIVRGVEIIGVAAVLIGGLLATVSAVRRRRSDADHAYKRYRRDLGRSILVGLEFLVAADIIRTVAIEPTFENVGVLGLLVVVRTVLSFSLEVEIDGRWPWQRSGSREASADES